MIGGGVLTCGIVNGVYEILVLSYGLNENCYRLLIFRYLLVISFGCYLYIGRTRFSLGFRLVMLSCGIFFQLAVAFGEYNPFYVLYWRGTSYLSCLYVLPIAEILIRHIAIKNNILEKIGRSSYGIFLIQMCFFAYGASLTYDIVTCEWQQILVCLLFCVVTGIVFENVANFFTRKAMGLYNYVVTKKISEKARRVLEKIILAEENDE